MRPLAFLRKLLKNSDKQSGPPQITARQYIDAEIRGLPSFEKNAAVNIDQCLQCIERIPGILHPMEGYTLLLLAMAAPTNHKIVEVGSYLGRSTCYMALGSMITGKKGVCAVDMFPKKSDWYRGEDGYYHIYGSDYYLPEHIYKERETFLYGDKAYESTLAIFTDIIKRVGLQAYIEPFKGNSLQCAAQLKTPVRMVFIDGDHTYEGVKKDILALADKLVANGYLCFHDYSVNFLGVVQAVNEFVIGSTDYDEIFQVRDLLVARKKSSPPGKAP